MVAGWGRSKYSQASPDRRPSTSVEVAKNIVRNIRGSFRASSNESSANGGSHGRASHLQGQGTSRISGKGSAMEAGSKDKKLDVYFRLVMNCSEYVIVGVMFAAHVWLNVTGLWDRQTTSTRPPVQGDWTTVGTACRLTPTGFQSCGPDEASLTTALAWSAIGTSLATQFADYIDANYSLPVATCVMGLSQGYGSIVLLVGDEVAPYCIPDAPDSVLGLALLETTYTTPEATSSSQHDVAYLLSTYVDGWATSALETRVGSDGASTIVYANVTKQLIAPTTGQVMLTDHNTTNWKFRTTPLLVSRYQLTYGCVAEIVQDNTTWTNHGGAVTGHALVVGWTCHHHVANRMEVTVVQYIALVGMFHFFGGDSLTTLKGIQGVLLHKPVLTYDFMSSLERRKSLMFLTSIFRLGACFYVEVARLYHVDAADHLLFFMSCAMANGLFTVAVYWPLMALQHVPPLPPLKGKVIRLYGPFLHLGTIFLSMLLIGASDLNATVYNIVWTRPQSHVPFLVHGQVLASGAYDTLVIAPCIQLLAPNFVVSVAVMVVLGFLYPLFLQRKLFLDTRYFQKNDFLTHEWAPNYVTFLPLYETECIKYGIKLFAKASTLALFGYGIIEEDRTSLIEVKPAAGGGGGAASAPATLALETPPFVVVQLYDLLPALLPHRVFQPHIVCTIRNYQYQQPPPRTTLRKSTTYKMSKGTCVS
ncbi:Aste57867_3526 [Aphanomyces stellatus]|uniref:Aste57867_3526 protein n=1 Tax=Aphanomyces stellatus TaxID=120398 RepID=A0A485KCA6_9STRA|nr:hypothetical protein As57867_003515 [Aphanomyces stellatus]VFT80689.1 Aste57867_3526 [Aphanomyces stellatus]